MATPEFAPPPRPQRQLDTVRLEGLDDLYDTEAPGRAEVKSREFPELRDGVRASDVRVVLYDAYSLDSFAACFAARKLLGPNARYEGVTRGSGVETLHIDVSGQVVAMLGVCWSLEAMHGLVAECDYLLILETHVSSARDLEQFYYPSAVRIIELDMGAGALAWNFFSPGDAVPPFVRAIEDAEVGREALRDARLFADGLEAAAAIKPPLKEISNSHESFLQFEKLLMEEDGRGCITRAIREGRMLRDSIESQSRDAAERYVVQTMMTFPAWRCALANVSSPYDGRVCESVAATAAERLPDAAKRVFGAVFEVRQHGVRVVLRSQPGGPDVSEIARLYGGSGRVNKGFFTVSLAEWDNIWTPPEQVFWDISANGPQNLSLKRGDRVTISTRGERMRENPFDEWSWGYQTDDPRIEGWIPTLCHTLYVALRAYEPAQANSGIHSLNEGDFVIARSQHGGYLYGTKQDGTTGWMPYTDDDVLHPVHPVSVDRWVATGAIDACIGVAPTAH